MACTCKLMPAFRDKSWPPLWRAALALAVASCGPQTNNQRMSSKGGGEKAMRERDDHRWLSLCVAGNKTSLSPKLESACYVAGEGDHRNSTLPSAAYGWRRRKRAFRSRLPQTTPHAICMDWTILFFRSTCFNSDFSPCSLRSYHPWPPSSWKLQAFFKPDKTGRPAAALGWAPQKIRPRKRVR
jgi:hypothetical protein